MADISLASNLMGSSEKQYRSSILVATENPANE